MRHAMGFESQGESAAPPQASRLNQRMDAVDAPATKTPALSCWAPMEGISSSVSRYTWGLSTVTARVAKITLVKLRALPASALNPCRPLKALNSA